MPNIPNDSLIPASTPEFVNSIKDALGHPLDLTLASYADGQITVAFISSIARKADVQNNILAPLGQIPSSADCCRFEYILPRISAEGQACRENLRDILEALMSGHTIIHLNRENFVYSFNTRGGAKRQPADPLIERAVRGQRVSFVETIEENLSLIRAFFRDPALRVEGLSIGRRTKTPVALIYLSDVVDPSIVQEAHRRLAAIDIDGIITSGYVEQLITDNRWSLFPLIQSTERPDKTASAILEGRVAIVVDGSSHVIIIPVAVNELYQSPEDYMWGYWFGSFLRFFRILGNNVAVIFPGLYVALVGVNPGLLPFNLTMAIASSRMGVAFPLLIELLLMEIAMEIFREASLRLPIPVSQTLGVTAGVVLGLSAVAAGIVSNVTQVVIIITAISSFSGPDYAIGLSWRLLRFPLIIAAALFGLYGLVIGGLVILAHAAVQNSFGVSYLAPWAPIHARDLGDTILRRPIWAKKRPATYHPANEVRYREQKGKDDHEK